MYAPEIPMVGQVAISRKGHDAQRTYLIVAVLSSEFVLCVDGKYRTAENPKAKRYKHLKVVGESADAVAALAAGTLTDANVRKICAEYREQGK